jgi:hypothetical protein
MWMGHRLAALRTVAQHHAQVVTGRHGARTPIA